MREAHTTFSEHPTTRESLSRHWPHGQRGHCRLWDACRQEALGLSAARQGELPVAFHVLARQIFLRKEEGYNGIDGLGLCSVQGNPKTGCFLHTLLHAGHCRVSRSTFRTSCTRPTVASPLVSTSIFKCPY